jgi:ParB family chromosome partitioning protein
MTSGDFHSVFIDQITVPERHRKKMGDIDKMARSLSRRGQINPILITRENVLVSGDRRLRAAKQLGWTHINCQYQDEVDEFTLLILELEENLKRKDMEWQEETTGLVEYHERYCAHDPKWNQDKTADEIGERQQWVSERLLVNDESKFIPDIWNEPDFSAALRRAKVNRENRTTAMRQTATEMVDELLGPTPKREAERPEEDGGIIIADFCEWAKTYKDEKFNFIHCDFPYGKRTEKRQQGNAITALGGYDDSRKTSLTLLKALCDNLDRICADSAHIMFWFSMDYYADTVDCLSKHFKIDPLPLIWVKSPPMGLVPDPVRKPRQIYETCLFGSRGDRKILTPVANAFVGPTAGEDHPSVKPEPMLRHFFRMFVGQYSRVLDPTCGSGTALRAAESLHAAHALGIEIKKQFADRAIIKLEESRQTPAPDPTLPVG